MYDSSRNRGSGNSSNSSDSVLQRKAVSAILCTVCSGRPTK